MGYYDNSILNDIEQISKILSKENLPENDKLPRLPLQQIIYGAPGTGKSFGVDEDVKKYNMKDIRTTFHPDSDYSTFVGAYKPTMANPQFSKRLNLSVEDLAQKLGTYYNDDNLGKVGGIQKFCLDYYPYIDGEYMSVNIQKLLELAGVPDSYSIELPKYLKFCRMMPKQEGSKIVYRFIQQAFLKAYIAAWKDLEHPHVLVIEEINRGNCAQIFGDLFQLLDRNDIGFSKYPITADTDIMQVLKEEFEDLTIANREAINANYKDDVVADVLNGSRLLLPNNLYIWATMNTSDQSLFPIDSAFKRRWEWKYVPISDAGKKWIICVNGTEYDWWSFIEKINNKIWDATKSEDKKLGYFFCKADRKMNESDTENNVISADRFVGKVLFYIYNDVFKDYGFDDAIFKDKDDNNSNLLFQCYFNNNGKPNETKIEVFLKNLEVKLASDVEEKNDNGDDNQDEDMADDQELTEGTGVTASTFKVQLNGEAIEGEDQFDIYLKALKKMGLDKVEEIAAEKEYNRYDCPFVSKEQFSAIQEKENFSYVEADGYQVIKGINKKGMSNFLKLCAEKLGYTITIE